MSSFAPTHLRTSGPADWLGWLLRRYRRLRVEGQSMEPLLLPGQEVLVDSAAYRRRSPQPGDLVVAYHPQQPGLRLVKWVVYVDGGGCYLQGLNRAASTDSRQFGLVPIAGLLGRVVCRLP